MFMEQAAKPAKKSSSTRSNNKNNLKEKYAKKSQENVLNGDKIKIVRYKENDAEKLKEKYSVKKSNARTPFDKEFLDSATANNENTMDTDAIMKSPEVEEIVSPKVNVFQFMMNSRHKVIGSNSPGKEKRPEPEKMPEEVMEKKEKTKKRKAALGEWAERKGGQKRKLADEAQEEHIKNTLKERAKRLKKMLEIIDEDLRNSSHDESDHEVKPIKKSNNKKSEQNDKIKSTEIDGSRENKIDTPDEKTETPKPKLQKSKDCDEKVESSENYKKTPKIKSTKKGNSKKIQQKDELKSTEIDESCVNKIDTPDEKTETSKSKLQKSEDKEIENSENLKKTPIVRPKRNKKSSSNNLEEVQEKSKINEDEKETPKRRVTRKQINSESKKNNLENDQVKILNTPENNKDNNVNNAEDKEEESSKLKSIKNVKKAIGTLSLKKNKKSITPEAEKKTEKTKSTNMLSDDDNEDISPINTPVSNKKTRQLKLFQDSNQKPVEGENKSFTPRSWKMKVRLFEKENINDDMEDDANSVIVIDDKESPKKSQVQGKISSFFGSSTSTNKSNSSEKRDVKLAPLFLKQQSKKLTKEEVEAKKKFLYSGMPEQVKKVPGKQQSIDEIKFDLFPKISHVQQRSSDDGTLHIFWDLPNASLLFVEKKIENINNIIFDTLTYGTLTDCTKTEIIKKHAYTPPTKLSNIKEYITALKKEYPNYPVFKTFRLLYEKYVKHSNKIESSQVDLTPSVKKRKGRPKKTKNINKETEPASAKESQMWTEKYKPLCQDDIIGNYSSVNQLKCWLQSWLHYSEDQKLAKKRKRANSSSDDFCHDSDTRDTADGLPQNMIILVGPFGTGKTASVYALCNELNINVIEINASSKRTGKRILTELQEATQSHQVKNTDSKSVNSFFQKKPEMNNMETKEEENKKLSLLLMEDVDIVFDDQDDGFISSLTTLVSSSKRPIILTTSDPNCLHLQKIFSQHDVIDFTSISCRVASPWLQILCLIEGIRINSLMVERLLEWNKGDVRKTLLQLQFWVQSGGDSTVASASHLNNKLTKYTLSQLDEVSAANDESSNLSWFQSETSVNEVDAHALTAHKSCVECFTPFYENDNIGCLQLSFPIDLGKIWWNMPAILNVDTIAHNEIFKTTETLSNTDKETDNQSDVDCSQNATKYMSDAEISNDKSDSENLCTVSDLKTVADFLESLVFTDTMYVKLKTNLDFEPTRQFWQIHPVNSLILTENYEMYNDANNLSYELSQWLVETNLIKCRKLNDDNVFDVNIAVPDLEERRWRKKIHKSMEAVTDIIPPFCLLDRTGICKDYFPFMRTICRVEYNRLVNNNKRKNRFYHYFKTFNIHVSDATNLILCNSLAIKNY